MLTIGVCAARSAEFDVFSPPGIDVSMVFVKGPIRSGDADRFAGILEGLPRPKASIVLISPGGLVKEALNMGVQIRQRNYATMVLPDQECYSACALIWISANRRYISPRSKIGFHAAYIRENGEVRETGMGNADIGSYLTHLGLRREAIQFITQSPPDEVSLLTPNKARELGIDIFEQDGTTVTPPSSKPTLDAMVRLGAGYIELSATCSNLFGLDAAEMKSLGEQTFKEGHDAFGGENFGRLLSYEMEAVSNLRDRSGLLASCVEAVRKVAETGRTVVRSPSFDCRKASTVAENAVCGRQDLSASDLAMSALYSHILKTAPKSVADKTRTSQRNWYRMRNACEDDADCISSTYELRLKQLEKIAFQ
ncbi:hypothetical protein ACD578_10500 [Microvirga sp. RSM25]|uniref:hypothetical protein n=1 Tax=Microvirga sp. RSM25 TaxID=3273802 RepID=UPI00384E3FC3